MAVLPSRYRKYGGATMNLNELEQVEDVYHKNEWPIPKYLQFIRWALEHKYTVKLHDAKTTVSKYVYVYKGQKRFKVRFSNHPPNYEREKNGDCDFFVGVTNFRITTTEDAKHATRNFLL